MLDDEDPAAEWQRVLDERKPLAALDAVSADSPVRTA